MMKAVPTGLIVALMAFACGATAALAQDPIRPAPAANMQKLSALIAKIEARPAFHYVDEIEWQSGVYTITYFTTDKAKVEIRIDPVTGEAK